LARFPEEVKEVKGGPALVCVIELNSRIEFRERYSVCNGRPHVTLHRLLTSTLTSFA
jgi:hypothetical protein